MWEGMREWAQILSFEPQRLRAARRQICDGIFHSIRKFVIGSAIQQSPCFAFMHATPLFKEKLHSLLTTLTQDIQHPFTFHWSRTVPALTTDDYPVNIREVDLAQILQ